MAFLFIGGKQISGSVLYNFQGPDIFFKLFTVFILFVPVTVEN